MSCCPPPSPKAYILIRETWTFEDGGGGGSLLERERERKNTHTQSAEAEEEAPSPNANFAILAIDNLALRKKQKAVITNPEQRFATDHVVKIRGSECLVALECFLNIVRALGMGSCLSAEGAAALPYALAAAAVSASTSASDDVGTGIKRGNSRKKMRTDSSSLDSNMETWLHRVPGRLFLNGSSEVASLFSKKGKKGINQDAMIVWENFGSRTDTIFCGVFDGHGPCGHMVAKKVRDSLPLKLSAQLQLNSIHEHGHDNIRSSALESLASEDIALMLADEEARTSNHKDSCPDFFTTMRGPFLKAFKVMDKELKLHPSIDCYCSGTTAVTLVKQRHDLIIANVGDSRAILGTRDEDDSLIAVQLTVDLKPDLPREAERIRRCKGRIFALQNEPEVARVWLPNCNSPGLAMARAFGDVCLKEFGLISVPDISYHRLTKKDEFVVLATDGIWDVLSNKEVVDIVASAPQSAAAQAVVDLAVRAWKSKFPYGKVDDCAVVCLFLDSNSNHYSAFNSTQ